MGKPTKDDFAGIEYADQLVPRRLVHIDLPHLCFM